MGGLVVVEENILGELMVLVSMVAVVWSSESLTPPCGRAVGFASGTSQAVFLTVSCALASALPLVSAVPPPGIKSQSAFAILSAFFTLPLK